MALETDKRRTVTPGGVAAATAILAAMLVPGLATAQEWRFEPVFRAGVESDDNARLNTRTDEEIELQGWLAEFTPTVIMSTQTSTLDISPRVLVRRYPDEERFESEDIFLEAQYDYEGQKTSFGLRTLYDEQQIRTAERDDVELDVTDPDEIVDDSSERVGAPGERSKLRVLPSWRYRFADRGFFELDLAYIDVAYDEDLTDRLTDYTDTRIEGRWRQPISETTSFVFIASARRYEQDEPDPLLDSDVDGYGARIGFVRDLSPTVTLRALAGAESVDQEIAGSTTEVVGDLSLRQRLETIEFLALYRRNIASSGSGNLSLRDSIAVNATRDLTEKISAGVGLRAYRAENLTDLERDDREYVQLRSQFTWNFTRTVSMTVDYAYSILNRGNLSDESANSNEVRVWFSYEPNPRDR